MKKKILLAALFSVTTVLAAVGLATEKTMAQGGLDDPFWMETGESQGASYNYEVTCSFLYDPDRDIFFDNTGALVIITHQQKMQAIGCAMVSTQACTPYSPC